MAKKHLGIDELFVSTVVPTAVTDAVRRLALADIYPATNQPRRYFEPTALAALVDSIKEYGVLQPLIVRERPHPKVKARYEIVAGERRWQAAQLAGLQDVPVIVRSLTDEAALAIALTENLQRSDLNPIEETEGYLALLDLHLREEPEFVAFQRTNDSDPYGAVIRLLFAMNNNRKTLLIQDFDSLTNSLNTTSNNNVVIKLSPIVEQIFQSVGTSTWLSFLQHRLPLRKLPNDVLEALREGKLEYTKARLLGRITEENLGANAKEVVARRATLLARVISENISVKLLKELVDEEIANFQQDKQAEPSKIISWQKFNQQTTKHLRRLEKIKLSSDAEQKVIAKLEELLQFLESVK
jgi:ParB family transcriptional regulator, chromosome partitioning protein